MNSVNATRESDAIRFRGSQTLHRHALSVDVLEILSRLSKIYVLGRTPLKHVSFLFSISQRIQLCGLQDDICHK